MSKERVVVSIGGSILIPGNNDAEFMKKLAQMLLKVASRVDL